jgi:integrase
MVRNKTGRDVGVIEYPKGSGNWHSRVVYRGRQHWRRAANKSHARELYHEMKAAIRRGEFPPTPKPKAVPFDDLVAEYREAKRREGKAVMASEVGFRRVLERFGGCRADQIATADVDQWRRELADTFAAATVNLHLCLLRAVLRHGVRGRHLSASALPEIATLKTNNKIVRYATEEEERRLLEVATEALRPVIVTAIHTGMRKSELLNLRWNDIDFLSGTIHVREAKSGEGRRLLMNASARAALLTSHERRRQRLRARVVNRSEADGPVFSAAHGGFMFNLERDWYAALECAGISNLHFHDLRHTFASRLVMAGVDLYRVQTLMGHKTQTMTLRYAHLSPQHLRAAVAMLDAAGPKPWAASYGQRWEEHGAEPSTLSSTH